MASQFIFDHGQIIEDDFLRFYRKFRPSLASLASFQESHTTTSSSSANFSELRLQRLRKHSYPEKGLPKRLEIRDIETTEEEEEPNMIQEFAIEELSDRATFSSCSSNVGFFREDLQSRDSGNSSGGSPDNLRHELFGLPTSFELDSKRNEGSVYSYETARDMMDPADIILESARETCRSRGASCTSCTCTMRERAVKDKESDHLEFWYPENSKSRRRKWDFVEEAASSSVSASKQYLDFDQRTNIFLSRISFSFFCRVFWFVVKSLLMTSSICLLLFIVLFQWRSYKCDNQRQKQLNVEDLGLSLERNMVGQHVAQQQLIRSLQDFTAQDFSVMVLILTGWHGTGKTLASAIVRNHFPTPENVQFFSIPVHFAKDTNNFYVLNELSLHISRSCGYSMVIFEDLNKIAADKTLENIERFVVTLKSAKLASRSNGTLVVISTNAGGEVIDRFVLNAMRSNISTRDSLEYNAILQVLSNEGVEIPCVKYFQQNEISTRVIPFLPLTRDHVRQCIRNEVHARGGFATNLEIENTLSEIKFFAEDFPVLSMKGCALVAGKLDEQIL